MRLKKTVLALAVAAVLTAPLAAQQAPLAIADQIQVLLDQLKAALASSVSPPAPLTTAAGLNSALASAQPGAVITLSSQFAYSGPLNIVTPGVTLRAETLPAISRNAAGYLTELVGQLPLFPDGITVTADGVTLKGLEVRKVNHTVDVLTVLGANATLDQLRVLGDPAAGAKRGIAAHANGNLRIFRSYVADCFGPYPGNDTQAILAWDMLPGLLVEDNYLEGGSETVMVGGADSSSADRDPRDITIRSSTLTKKAAWQAQLVGVKNVLELKNARNVLVELNDISQSWGGHGQDGYAVAFTVRNQSGTNPTATIQDVIFRNNRVHHAAAAVNFLGTDNNAAAIKMARVQVVSNTFSDLSPSAYTGAVKAFLFGGGSTAVELRDNVMQANANFSSVVYFYGAVPANVHDGLAIVGNAFSPSTYGVFGEGSSPMNPAAVPGAASAITRYVAAGSYSGNVVQ